MRDDWNNGSPELLLFDLDGTLLDSQKRISAKNLKAIEKCRSRGIMIGIATARSESTCARFTERIKPDLLISNSGALVRLHGKVIYQCSFTPEETAVIVGAGVAEHRGITVDCEDTTYCNRNISFFNEPGMTYTDFSDFARSSFKICIEGADIDFAQRTAELIQDCSWLVFSDCDWFKFSKSNVSKGDALRHVVNSTGIPTAHMTAFGDDFVDVEMIDICGVGIAMENAVDEVKLHADMIIGSNDTDAISEYISRFVL
ncbi:MAG: HAD family hydrolase [Ruminococcus sp.]|nr:HAD family hydrolase [Ruminococcus sp.]